MTQIRTDLLSIFSAATDAVSGEHSVRRELINNCKQYPDQFHVVAIGKASDAMLKGVISTETPSNKRIISALLISKHDHICQKTQNDPRVHSIESDHPIPKEASMRAGDLLLNYVKGLPENEPCLFLISGGTSSLVEVLPDEWDLPQLQALTDYLLSNGYSINQMNAIRRRISNIKGGGLWNFLGDRAVSCLMISDVPNDCPSDIGSGLLFHVDDMDLPDLPEEFTKKIPKYYPKKPASNFKWKIIASLDTAKKVAETTAKALGYTVKVQPEFLEDEASKTAKNCINTLEKNPNTLFIWGGETTVYLSNKTGIGGRNQHLALSAAIALDKTKNTFLLAAGTDGSDGVSTATGAVIDNKTLQRGEQHNLTATEYLLDCDANTYLSATNDVIITGATGTNVMDLVLGISIH